ncbi:calcium/sodium antiporter [Candidatus Hecatella orcuttiae]|uniref:calcium/sodium antiporter n=1 Tax=Candidatus Hecatella orcuttiae TaxID=1935119 RepID=UPI002867DC18|nr:calcium/sodium antiporter [Candidatus Hecatella orcuttiae]
MSADLTEAPLISFTVFISAFIFLLKSADFFVDGAAGLADKLGLPRIFIGIVLMGFLTTSPEFAVSVQAAYLGHPEVALGNAVGSVVADDAFALALAAIIAGISIDKQVLKRFGVFLIFSALLSYLLALDASVTRVEGLVLASLLVGYYLYLIKTGAQQRKSHLNTEGYVEARKVTFRRVLLLFLTGAGGVIVSARLVVWSGLSIAEYFGIPEVVIGLTVIALGTSLPEISTAVVSARKGKGEIAVGNILGADVLNILWIIGVSALVNPIKVDPKTIEFAYPWMLLVVAVMLLLMRHRYELTRWKGLLLLSLYVVYLFQLAKFFY